MKIVFLTYEDSSDINSWSGTYSIISNHLAKDNDLEIVDKLQCPIDVFFKLVAKLHTLTGHTSDFKRNKLLIKLVTKRIQKRLEALEYDLIFVPGSLLVANLKVDKPIVIWADATFQSLIKSYPQYSKLTIGQIKAGDELEKLALDNATKIIFAASWAANSAINDYNIPAEKVEIIPFGSNVNNNLTESDIVTLNQNKDKEKIRLLFIGADWEKKGGDLLLKIFDELRALSDIYDLDIVGSAPEKIPNIKGVTFHGFLNKSNESDSQKLESLFESSHYFLLPTKAEAFGIVFCEANSYGLPAFGSNLGGIVDIIKDSVNGELIDIEKSPKELALQIHKYIIEGDYNDKSKRAFRHYKENFTWEKSIEKVNKVLKELV